MTSNGPAALIRGETFFAHNTSSLPKSSVALAVGVRFWVQ